MLNENSDPSRDDSWLAEETGAAMRDFAEGVPANIDIARSIIVGMLSEVLQTPCQG